MTQSDAHRGAAGRNTTPRRLRPQRRGWATTAAALGVWLGCAAAAAQPLEEEGEDFDVTIEASRPRVTASERHVDRDTLDATPRTTAEDLLRLVPGVVLVQHGNEGKGHQFYLRGFDAVHGSDVEVLLEGIPLNEWSNVHGQGYLDLAFIVPEVVSSLDVTKGAYRLEQGNFATAGTVRFNLGVPRRDRGTRLLYEVGTTNRHRIAAIASPESGDGETFAALEAMRDDGFGANRQTERISGMGQATLWRDGETSVSAFGSGYLSAFGLPGLLRYEDFTGGDVGFYDSYTTTDGGLSGRAITSVAAKGRVGDGEAEARLYGMWRRLRLDENFTGFLRYPDRSDRRYQRQEAWSGGLRARVTQRVAPELSLEALGTWHSDVIDQRERQLDVAGVPWLTTRDLTIAQHAGAVGVGGSWSPLSWLAVEGGARLDLFRFDVTDHDGTDREGSDTLLQASPRLTAIAFPGVEWSVFAGYGRGLRAPEARAVTRQAAEGGEEADLFQGGDPEVTATDNVEVGARWEPLEGWAAIGLTGFGTWIERESVFDHVSGINLELNGTRRLGVEAEVRVSPWSWLDVTGDVTALQAQFVESGEPIPGAPRWLGTLRGIVSHPSGGHGGLHVLHIGPRALAHGAVAGRADAGSAVPCEDTADRRRGTGLCCWVRR